MFFMPWLDKIFRSQPPLFTGCNGVINYILTPLLLEVVHSILLLLLLLLPFFTSTSLQTKTLEEQTRNQEMSGGQPWVGVLEWLPDGLQDGHHDLGLYYGQQGEHCPGTPGGLRHSHRSPLPALHSGISPFILPIFFPFLQPLPIKWILKRSIHPFAGLPSGFSEKRNKKEKNS